MCLNPPSYNASVNASVHDLTRHDVQSPQPLPLPPSFDNTLALESPAPNTDIVDTLPRTTFIPPGFPTPVEYTPPSFSLDTLDPTPTVTPLPPYAAEAFALCCISGSCTPSMDGLIGPGVHAPNPMHAYRDYSSILDYTSPPPRYTFGSIPPPGGHDVTQDPLASSAAFAPPPTWVYNVQGITFGALAPPPAPIIVPVPVDTLLPLADQPLHLPALITGPLVYPGFVTTDRDIDTAEWRGSHGVLLLVENEMGQPGAPKFCRARGRVGMEDLRTVETPRGPALCGSLQLVPSHHAGRAYYFNRSMEAIQSLEALHRIPFPLWHTFIRRFIGNQFQMSVLALEEYPIISSTMNRLGRTDVPCVPGSLVGRDVDIVFVCYQIAHPDYADRILSLAMLIQLQLID
ncbi:hypothetical protein BDN72DRAFT_905424 [Pluteus cervinus]|uniref:Uncharacterized protein n=1 Tax=Pluteus cervinus TaxID=181527 RepID=A0ACD3A2M3_9AGAR|nr:hypothetical protein BDN72DRAFT_905424 [Pluteus cervinus]